MAEDMDNTMQEITESLQKKGIRISEKSKEQISFDSGAAKGILLYLQHLMLYTLWRTIARKAGEEDYRKINDLNARTLFGKHCIRYNEEYGIFEYVFEVQLHTQNVTPQEALDYTLKAFSLAYKIIQCPDVQTSHELIREYREALR